MIPGVDSAVQNLDSVKIGVVPRNSQVGRGCLSQSLRLVVECDCRLVKIVGA